MLCLEPERYNWFESLPLHPFRLLSLSFYLSLSLALSLPKIWNCFEGQHQSGATSSSCRILVPFSAAVSFGRQPARLCACVCVGACSTLGNTFCADTWRERNFFVISFRRIFFVLLCFFLFFLETLLLNLYAKGLASRRCEPFILDNENIVVVGFCLLCSHLHLAEFLPSRILDDSCRRAPSTVVRICRDVCCSSRRRRSGRVGRKVVGQTRRRLDFWVCWL